MKFRNNKNLSRYEMEVEGVIAFIDYKFKEVGKRMYLIHTEVPEAIRHLGVAEKLVLSALMEVKVKGWKLMPLCPYIVTYIKRHPEWVEIVDESKKQLFI